MANMNQLELAKDLIGRIERRVCLKERDNGYNVKKPGAQLVGFVRFNMARSNAGKYMVYAYQPFCDPRGMFENCTNGKPSQSWKCVVNPNDEDTIRYVIAVLESSYDMKCDMK